MSSRYRLLSAFAAAALAFTVASDARALPQDAIIAVPQYGGIEKLSGGVLSPVITTPGYPAQLAADSAGNIFATQNLSSAIYEVTSSGIASTFADTGFSRTGGIAFDIAGNLYVGGFDNAGSRILKYAPGNTTPTIFVPNGSLVVPTGLAFDSQGNLFVSNNDFSGTTHWLSKVTSGGVVSTFASFSGGTAINLQDLAIDASDNIFVGIAGAGIDKITPGGTVSNWVDLTTAGNPWGMEFDHNGNLYVVDNSGQVLDLFDPSGTLLSQTSGIGPAIGLALVDNVPVPEPASTLLLAGALAALAASRRRR